MIDVYLFYLPSDLSAVVLSCIYIKKEFHFKIFFFVFTILLFLVSPVPTSVKENKSSWKEIFNDLGFFCCARLPVLFEVTGILHNTLCLPGKS